jgi:glucoamylase
MAADTIELTRPSLARATRAAMQKRAPTPAEIIEAKYAPGWPGSPGRWTSSAKSGVGSSLSPMSSVWFTLSHGVLNEIYYRRIDRACTRDLGLIVTDGTTFFSEEKRHARSVVRMLEDGVPAYLLVNTCASGRYRIEKTVLADARRDVILQHFRFVPLLGAIDEYRLHVLLAPHLGNRGYGNTGWTGGYKGIPMLLAEGNRNALALASSAPWLARSAGFVGASDGWQDLARHKRMTWRYERAENGNIALTGEIDLKAAADGVILALGFGRRAEEAAHHALASLHDGFQAAQEECVASWRAWQATLPQITADGGASSQGIYDIGTAMMRVHDALHFPGAIIASLSVPWGFSKGDDDLGGYHLVWPRDLVEAAGGLIAAGAHQEARQVLHYLQATQESDGNWPQNMWLDGAAYWSGVQMDETAFPILLVDLANRHGALPEGELARLWPMVRRAAGFLVRNGPVTGQDRWEEDGGYSPFTLAVEIAALLAAADLALLMGACREAAYLCETADTWNDQIEYWTYSTGTELARQCAIDGYYVRIAPPETADAASPLMGFVPIKNRPPGQSRWSASQIVSADALALVRFGLRSADDPRITNTVRVIDALLRTELPQGPLWRRYNEDGYGEHEDGLPFDGAGIGRVWPLLTGERAHYEIAAGRLESARALLRTLEACASDGGLLPEQVWDGNDIPERGLYFGRPSGSAMPLVWAHAEHLKLVRSLHDGQVFDLPPQPVQRYQVEKITSPYRTWRFNHKCRSIPRRKTLRIEVLAPAMIHWSVDSWRTVTDTRTRDTGFGIHVADLPVPSGTDTRIRFTFLWIEAGHWEGTDFEVTTAAG